MKFRDLSLPVVKKGLRKAIGSYENVTNESDFIDALGIASIVDNINNKASLCDYELSIKKAIEFYIQRSIPLDEKLEKAIALSLGKSPSEYTYFKSNIDEANSLTGTSNDLKLILEQHKTHTKAYENAYFEIGRTRISDFCLTLSQSDEDLSPILISKSELNLIDLLSLYSELPHPLVKELNELIDDLINYLPFVYFCMAHKGDKNWICRIDTHMKESDAGYRPLLRLKSKTPLGLMIKILDEMEKSGFKNKTSSEIPKDTKIKCKYPEWE